MERLTDIGTIRSILSRYGFTFSKALGQNFLVNPSVCPRMADAAVQSDNNAACDEAAETGVLEIGPGIGVLTKELCERAGKVVAIELDKRLLPVLDETLGGYDNLKIVNADVMALDLKKLITDEFGDRKVAVCANLPYYITSPVIMKLLEEHLPITSITVMVQKEAAVRLCAEPGTRDSSAVTAAVRYYCDPELLFYVKAGSFMPAPKVDSAVIQLRLREPAVHPASEADFFRTVRGAFAQRRKTVLNSLSSSLSLDKNTIRDILSSAGVDEAARAERLTLEEFARIADALYEFRVKRDSAPRSENT